MATHKRSRTGCWTCREAGYKCDELKPFCGRCTRLRIVCKGYGVKLKWQDDAVSTLAKPPRKGRKKKSIEQHKTLSPASVVSFASTPMALSSPEFVFSSPESTKSMPTLSLNSPGLSYGLSPDDRWLLNYWVEQLSTLISVAPRNGVITPFQRHLTAMAYDIPALRSTILSMAANHLASNTNDASLHLQRYRHQRDAIRELQKMIHNPVEMNVEPALATVMMMQVSARLFGDDETHVANHLAGAKAMIAGHGGDNWLESSSVRFLVSLFAYHDILSSVSRGSRPLLDHEADFSAIEGEQELESIANVLLVVAQISQLQYVIKTRRSQSPFSLVLSEDENTTGRHIQQTLLAMDFVACKRDTSEHTDIILTAEAYRHAAFIYLYRTWLDIGAPNPISVEHINQCLSQLQQVNVHSPLTSAHMWPLFTAGCEAIDSTQRQFVRDRFESLYAVKRFPSLKRVMRDIEHVWAAKDMEQQMKGEDDVEALPPELFNRVLDCVFDPKECATEDSNTRFGGYRFETSLLCVNKNVHLLARSYLHHALCWVRFELNWGAFAIDPHWLGVKYLDIRHIKATKSLPTTSLALRLRSMPQEAPPGRLHVKLEFPRAEHEAQKKIANVVKSSTDTTMLLLVLEKDLAGFMQVLRMNDLAYCRRDFPGTRISGNMIASRGVHGIKSEITVTPGQHSKRYQHLLLELHIMRDSLHENKVIGHEDGDLAKKSVDYIQQQHIYKERLERGLTKDLMSLRLSMEVMAEGIASLLWLKDRGDKYLTQGLYSNAYMCYSNARILEKSWLEIAPPPTEFRFWTTDSCIFVTFKVALRFNMAIAEMTGDLELDSTRFPRKSIYGYYGILAILSGGGRLLADERYVELSIVAHMYEILTVPTESAYHLTCIEETWEEYNDPDDDSDRSSGLGPLYQVVKRLNDAGHTPTSHPESLTELKAAAHCFKRVAPLKWAITEHKVPNPLRELIQYLPRIQLLPDGAVENPGNYSFEIPVDCETTDEQRLHAEDQSRYII